jgi:predicted membrane channel-forming protein YqfA (hemolysin III family)
MLDRIVALALFIGVACFVFGVAWPILDDDPPSLSQIAFVSSGLIVITIGAYVYWTRSS